MAFINFRENSTNQLTGIGIGKDGKDGYLSIPKDWFFEMNETKIEEANLMVLSNFIQIGDEATLNCNFNMNGWHFLKNDDGLIITAG